MQLLLRALSIAGLAGMTGMALAQEIQAPIEPESDDSWNACMALDVEPRDTYNALAQYSVVFGKPAIEWKQKDYDQLMDLAVACNGVTLPDGRVVDASDWRDQIEKGLRDVYTVAALHQQIMERARNLSPDDIRLPDCGVLATYDLPDKDLHDNSGDIFGIPFYGMSRNDLDAAIAHINNCMAFLPQYGFVAFKVPPGYSQKVVYGMMDRALTIEAYHEEWKTWAEKRPTDIVVEFEGYVIPPSFLTEEGKSLVRRYNRAKARTAGLTLDAVYNLISITEGMLDEPSLTDIDRTYAAAIKAAVSDQIFEQTGKRSVVAP